MVCCILLLFFVTDPPLGLFPFCRVPTGFRQADRPSKPGMPSTGMGQYRARAIVPETTWLPSKRMRHPRARMVNLASLLPTLDQNGEDTRAALNGVLDIGAWADA